MNRFRAYLELIRYPLFAIPIVATLPGALIASQRAFYMARCGSTGYCAFWLLRWYDKKRLLSITKLISTQIQNARFRLSRLTPRNKPSSPRALSMGYASSAVSCLTSKPVFFVMGLVCNLASLQRYLQSERDFRKSHTAFGNWGFEYLRSISR